MKWLKDVPWGYVITTLIIALLKRWWAKSKEIKVSDEKKYGVKELKELIGLILSLLKVGKGALADGKLSLVDLAGLLVVLPNVQAALEGITEVPAELKDLDQDEAAELASYVMVELAVDDAKAKEVVEAALKALVAIYAVVKAIAK